MAGILDVKSRIIDAIITKEGRRQMANGTIRLNFASFSDEGIFYDSENGKSARDISDLPILEVMSLPRDTVIPEVDSKGVFSLQLSDGTKIVNGRNIISGTYDIVSDNNGVRTVIPATPIVTGTLNVYSGSSALLNTSKDHFDQLNIIGTDDGLDKSEFSLNLSAIKLNTTIKEATLSTIKPLVFSNMLNHTIQTQYMVPYYQETKQSQRIYLGSYPKYNSVPINNFKKFTENLLNEKSVEGKLPQVLSKKEIHIHSQARSNNLLGQMFEINKNGFNKLVVIDYGSFTDENNQTKQVFFLGKPIRDMSGVPKLCRIFTLVFEK